jgi:hypothetical protein
LALRAHGTVERTRTIVPPANHGPNAARVGIEGHERGLQRLAPVASALECGEAVPGRPLRGALVVGIY